MRLTDDLFEVREMTGGAGSFSALIRLDPEHIIFKGHFPGFPVTPGVIQVQIVHELLEGRLDRKLQLRSMPRCKFLRILDPRHTRQIRIQASYKTNKNGILVKALGQKEKDLIFRFEADFIDWLHASD